MNKKLISLFVSCSIFATPITTLASSLELGTRGADVVKVQVTLKDLGYFNYPKITAYFGTVTEQALKDFQSQEGLDTSGILDKQTKDKLNVNSNDFIKGGALDWFDSVQYIFPREQEATVTDVDTGKSFKLKRSFGTNHADVEPLTQEDTNIIKDIWGGFSWERRAVVVEIDNILLAGSMTAFPHAGLDSEPALKIVSNRSGNYGRGQNLDTVKGNGIDGHMDIHFLNSRTHGTNVVQKSHQGMVKKAEEYIYKNY